MSLKSTLQTIKNSEYRKLDSHPKRGSVAIILRVPDHYHFASLDEYLENLPLNASPELVFIKRAANPRDRWSGHIALPGGRHDKGETDRETAQRETLEEVGVDLNKDGFYVGGLDQRLLKVSWGRRVAMVLCPYVFVVNSPVEFSPQWSEVGSVFWHSLDDLLRPDRQTLVEVPIGDRLDLSWLGPLKPLVASQLGNLQFSAVDLWPEIQTSQLDLGNNFKCWGVTLGVLSDVFEIYSPGHFLTACWLPTIGAWDMRFWIWILNGAHTRSKRLSIAADIQSGPSGGKMDLMNKLLEGHFKHFPLAIGTAVSIRFAIIAWIVFVLKKKLL